jgi:predicted acetyltransferase
VQVALLEAAAEAKPIFHNLMQLYLHEMSEWSGADPDRHGLYAYPYLDRYWTAEGRDEGRVPLLIMADDRLAGFVLKNRWSYRGAPETEHTVAEFFVLRKWRRQGVGRRAALELFRRFPGRWEVGEEHHHLAAQAFWRAVIGEYTAGAFREVQVDSPAWHGPVQLFDSRTEV